MKQVKVLFFATLKSLTGTSQTVLDLPDQAKVVDLKTLLQQEFPGLGSSLDSMLISINREFAFDEDTIPDGAEIAVFPPVSGGSAQDFPGYFETGENPIPVLALQVSEADMCDDEGQDMDPHHVAFHCVRCHAESAINFPTVYGTCIITPYP